MKNRKKIFIFVLLLCTFFSTLFTLTPNVKAVENGTLVSLGGATITWKDESFYWTTNLSFNISFDAVDNDSIPQRFYSFDKFTLGSNGYFTIYVPDPSGASFYRYDYDNKTYSYPSSIPKTWIINGGSDITNTSLCSFIQEHCIVEGGVWEETPTGYDVTLNPTDTSLDFDLFAIGEVLYQINESGYNVPIYTSQTPLPYTIENVENIKFINNSTDYRLLVYQSEQTYSVIEPGNQSLLYSITSDKIINLELVTIEPEVTTYTINGGYMFNPTISSSIFGDYTEQLIDIRLSNNFYLYDLRLLPFNQFSIYSDSENPNILYFTYVNTPDERTTYAGTFTNNGNIITNVAQRTIYFEEQEVSEEVYNWLTNNGRFGNFDNTLPEPSPDNPFGFVVDMVNDFLQIEFLPGFRFIHLLYIGVSIPLCIFILKLFLGG